MLAQRLRALDISILERELEDSCVAFSIRPDADGTVDVEQLHSVLCAQHGDSNAHRPDVYLTLSRVRSLRPACQSMKPTRE